MSAPQSTWVISVLLPDDMLVLNRAIGIIRRRNLPVASLALGPAGRPGSLRLTCAVTTDRAAVERMANAVSKMVEAREVAIHSEAECITREHALVRVRVPSAGLSALLDAVSLYQATIVDERPDELLIEATGTSPFMLSFLRALEPFGVLEVARGGALALPRPEAGEASGTPRMPVASARMPAAIPA